jgi:putative endonuclease
MDSRGGAVYILTNRGRTVLYTGVTSDLARRIHQHVAHVDPRSFTARYKAHILVYYEPHDDILTAIEREKQIKGWTRSRKVALIASMNPDWDDLYAEAVA